MLSATGTAGLFFGKDWRAFVVDSLMVREQPDRVSALFGSLHNKQSTGNWYGQEESDCLIKT